MKILLVYPAYPDTFWSFKHALKFISRKATFPPLGLLTVAAMLPAAWEKKLINLNTDLLTDKDLLWADYVFLSAMAAQQESTKEVINQCKKLGTKIVAGGPLFATGYEEFGFDDIDHLVLSESEDLLPFLVKDLEEGCARHIYESHERPDITKTPVPQWSLIDKKKYQTMSLQYSRGCPFDCEFCDIIIMNGRTPRTKTKEQMVAELETLYKSGWKGSIFFVDDNFIGNKRKLKEEILPTIIQWAEGRKHPFRFFTEASIDLADDEELMQLMTKAGFDTVFVGIESPNEESLNECNKLPNKNRDLLASVKKIHNHGLRVMGGFIVGFDSDSISIFKTQINFIQKSGIVTAMVGLLMAPPETRLYKRLEKENRLLPSGTGDNTDGSTNIIPKMGYATLVNGYKHILNTIYAPKHYYQRIQVFLDEYKPQRRMKRKLRPHYIGALFKSMWYLGVKEKERWHYWKLFISTLLKYPKFFPLSIGFAIEGFHLRKVAEKISHTTTNNQP